MISFFPSCLFGLNAGVKFINNYVIQNVDSYDQQKCCVNSATLISQGNGGHSFSFVVLWQRYYNGFLKIAVMW